MGLTSHVLPQIGPLAAGHIPAVVALEKACFPTPWSAEQFAYGLERGVLGLVGATQDHDVWGYCSFYRVADEGEIVNIAVDPRARRQGLGRRILAFVLQKLADEGITRVFLEVRATNLAAIGLYTALGFRRTGTRRAYYPDTREDAWVMTFTPATWGRPT